MAIPDKLGGLTLAQFAGVTAATAEGISLTRVLAQEQIPPRVWTNASALWREVLVESTSAQVALVGLRRIAEDCLARAISPLDEDPASWLGLLAATNAATDARGLLASLGLSAADLSRLGRQWKAKAKASPEIAMQLREAAAAARAASKLEIAPLVLRPFPWTPEGFPPAPEHKTDLPAAAAETSATAPVARALASFQIAAPPIGAGTALRIAEPSRDAETSMLDGRAIHDALLRPPLPFVEAASEPKIPSTTPRADDAERGATQLTDGHEIQKSILEGALPFRNAADIARSSVKGRIERFAVVQVALAKAGDVAATLAGFGFSADSWESERQALYPFLREPEFQRVYEAAWHAEATRY